MLFLDRSDVAELLPLADCIAAVERAFAAHARGELPSPAGVSGTHVTGGGFHVKTATLGGTPGYYAAKVNANFPGNPARHGLPTIQGLVALFDLADGRPLALLDSVEITTRRTAAATALAARHLALEDAGTLTICGCGSQARAQVRALMLTRRLRRAWAWDVDCSRAAGLARELAAELGIEFLVAPGPLSGVHASDIVVTCTPARSPLLSAADLQPGQFIAAVGADSEDKQELAPELMAQALVVTDLTAQAASIGDLHHAIAAGLMTAADVHAELGQLVTGQRPGRSDDAQVFVFDSTGTALQDVAAAALVYERASASGRGRTLALSRND